MIPLGLAVYVAIENHQLNKDYHDDDYNRDDFDDFGPFGGLGAYVLIYMALTIILTCLYAMKFCGAVDVQRSALLVREDGLEWTRETSCCLPCVGPNQQHAMP